MLSLRSPLALIFLFTLILPVAFADEAPDTIFFGGDVVTVNEAQPEAEALAICDGRIIAVGDRAEILALQGTDTTLIDLKGATVMPGFVEPHTHPAASAGLYAWVDVSGFTHSSAEDVMQQLRDAAANAKPGEWILAFGWDPILVPGLESLTADILDEISTTNPIFVMMQSMHTHYVNHKAFELAGITDDTPQPGRGGEYVKDEQGHLTGMLREAPAVMRFMMAMPPRSAEVGRQMIERQLERYSDAGITTIGIAGLINGFVPRAGAVLKEIAESDDARVRVRSYIAGNRSSAKKTLDAVESSDRFGVMGIKYWYDGSPYTGTMLLDAPYTDSVLMQEKLGLAAGLHGHSMFTAEQLTPLLQATHDAGTQIAIHTQGDRSTREVIDLLATTLKDSPRDNHRHRLEHLALVRDEDLHRAAELGITPSFHMNHIYYYGQALRDSIVGPERAGRLMPAASAAKYGHRFSFHTDSPMYPANPLLTMRTAVTRLTREGDVLGSEQAISVDNAIRGITINAAWQMFMDDQIGSLEVGKLADLVILSENPRKTNSKELHEIDVLATYLEGRKIAIN